MIVSLESAQPTRPVLRKLLRALFRTDADFDAFALDYFAEVHARFARGMDRVSKVNLLLELAAPVSVLLRLRKRFSSDREVLELIVHHLAERDTEDAQKAWALREQLERLYIVRDERRLRGEDTRDIDAQLVSVKRTQRQSPQLQEGETLGDRYRLLEIIGRGGFARIWQAYDRISRHLVAVKILHAEPGDDARRIERFIRGARQMKDLEHPNIVRVLDGPAEYHGYHFFVMDYFSGGDLFRAIANGSLHLAEALQVLVHIGEALSHAHARRLVHRDVKPQNIVLDGHGGARLTDFDLVWAADSTGGTHTGFLGTHVYVAPEQAEDAKSVDERADVYSLGMTTLFVIHGSALPQRAVYQRALFIDGLGCAEPLKALLRRATAIDREDRPASVGEFCRLLAAHLVAEHVVVRHVPPTRLDQTGSPDPLPNRVLTATTSSAPIIGPGELRPQQSPRAPRRHVWLLGAVPTILGVLVLALGGSTPYWYRTEPDAKAKQAYERFASASASGNYDDALIAFREIPEESGYSKSARGQVGKIIPRFIDNHLTAAESARTAGNCELVEFHVQEILRVSPDNAAALQTRWRPCEPVTDATPPGPKRLAGYPPLRIDSAGQGVNLPGDYPGGQTTGEDIDRFLHEAQVAQQHGKLWRAVTLAHVAAGTKQHSPMAWRIVGVSACGLKNLNLINRALDHLDTGSRVFIKTSCAQAGFPIRYAGLSADLAPPMFADRIGSPKNHRRHVTRSSKAE